MTRFADPWRSDAERAADALHAVEAAVARLLHLPDLVPLHVSLAALAAHRIDADPVWPLIVGPPSSGKTEIVTAGKNVDHVIELSTITGEASLLSGTPAKSKAKNATGGVLNEIRGDGILLLKDFTSVLAMNRDTRASVLAALREIHDGHWSRAVGTDGGTRLEWRGKLTLIAAVTPVIDNHYGVIAAMGDRFVIVRVSGDDLDKQVRKALSVGNDQRAARQAIIESTVELLEHLMLDPGPPDADEIERLSELALLATAARSAVYRDYQGEIEAVPGQEQPGRLAKGLATLVRGATMIGLDDSAVWRLVARVALDSVPPRRYDALTLLHQKSLTTTQVAHGLDLPTKTTRRALEDLTAHHLVSRRREGRDDVWTISDVAARRLDEALRLAHWTPTDNSGQVPTKPELSVGVRGDPVDDDLGAWTSDTDEDVS